MSSVCVIKGDEGKNFLVVLEEIVRWIIFLMMDSIYFGEIKLFLDFKLGIYFEGYVV